MPTPDLNKSAVREYYGTTLQGSDDLKTDACCCDDEDLTPSLKKALAQIDDEILSRFYGCGSPIPPMLEGCTVLDLGCGTGRDVFVVSKLVGPKGQVFGVDMTPEQIEVAQRLTAHQMAVFGYATPNVTFCYGHMEDLKSLGIADASIDVVISNCVINLSPDKETVFSEIFRVLKPGGELYFSDVFSDRRVPDALHSDPVLHGECLAGAMYREDFRRILSTLNCSDPRIIRSRRLAIGDPAVEAKIGMIPFYSETVRAFALPALEDRSEDYGQRVTYRGTIDDYPNGFDLDAQHSFVTGEPTPVCGNTAAMLSESRYSEHFEHEGDRSTHFGLFGTSTAASVSAASSGCGC